MVKIAYITKWFLEIEKCNILGYLSLDNHDYFFGRVEFLGLKYIFEKQKENKKEKRKGKEKYFPKF